MFIEGVVNNITQTIQSIQAAVQEAETSIWETISEVVVGIAGQHIRSLQHSDYITRPNPEEVIQESDVEELINQVYKLCDASWGKKLSMFSTRVQGRWAIRN
ncbi:MAG: hypothetical protein CM15mP59_2160 [Flavobacteriaceae bacterium]|nr:MAG: hypothetical protein CM15mP59_2160 [Flavobacteriaceae bacterium]